MQYFAEFLLDLLAAPSKLTHYTAKKKKKKKETEFRGHRHIRFAFTGNVHATFSLSVSAFLKS